MNAKLSVKEYQGWYKLQLVQRLGTEELCWTDEYNHITDRRLVSKLYHRCLFEKYIEPIYQHDPVSLVIWSFVDQWHGYISDAPRR